MHRSAQGSSGTGLLGDEKSREIIPGETMAAIATPSGEGAIAIVRISGANAIDVANRIFRGHPEPSQFIPNVQHLGNIVDGC